MTSRTSVQPALKEFSFRTRKGDLAKLKSEVFDLLIVGGGINGAWLALDATLRGQKVALIEAKDFGHGPSRNNSELLHGGFRYLKEWYENPRNWLRFASVLRLVREALREREVLMAIAPHLARPMPFVMPIFAKKGHGILMRSFYAFGYLLYDQLAAAQKIKSHRMLKKDEVLRLLPGLQTINAAGQTLAGGGLYYDAKMEPGRFLIEIIKAAAAAGAICVSECKALKPIREGKKMTGMICRDGVKREDFSLQAKKIVDVTGPWGDEFRQSIWPKNKNDLRLSKGVHVMVPKMFPEDNALAFFSPEDGRIIFVIPWGENYQYSLIGTTDTDYSERPDAIAPDQKSIDYLLSQVGLLFPEVSLHPLGNYAGIRPLIRKTSGTASSVSREHAIHRHREGNIYSVFGGKWTTARRVAAEALDLIFPETRKKCQTHTLRLGGTGTAELLREDRPNPSETMKRMAEELRFSERTLAHLIFHYGENAWQVLAIARKEKELRQPILPEKVFIKAEIAYAVRYEMALHVSDFLIRRNLLGRLRGEGLQAAPTVAAVMGEEMGWSLEKRNEEVERYEIETRIVTAT